ncbi:hypothetical protein ACPPVQ_06725 [Diaminobutyricibacter sp. McL0618]|uniref:hypothetical protein n=1 Tax=Leifsonia sp. McL0618 TaxID=3415677 RepID=UPI003CE84FC7
MAEPEGTPAPARPPLLIALAVLLFLEAAGAVALVVWLGFELASASPESVAGGVALVLLAVLAAAWILLTAVSTLRGRSWVRASAVTWQVLQIAVAIGSFQGLYARPDLGWALLVPAVVGIVLALSPSVVRATTRNKPEQD